jgi:hypothetical protein
VRESFSNRADLRRLKALDELLDLPYLDVLLRLILLRGTHGCGMKAQRRCERRFDGRNVQAEDDEGSDGLAVVKDKWNGAEAKAGGEGGETKLRPKPTGATAVSVGELAARKPVSGRGIFQAGDALDGCEKMSRAIFWRKRGREDKFAILYFIPDYPNRHRSSWGRVYLNLRYTSDLMDRWRQSFGSCKMMTMAIIGVLGPFSAHRLASILIPPPPNFDLWCRCWCGGEHPTADHNSNLLVIPILLT